MTTKVTVDVRDGNIEGALKVFKKKVMDSGHLYEYKTNQYFIPETTKRREAKKKARFNQRRKTNSEKTQKV
jgi:ribosomal protein S21